MSSNIWLLLLGLLCTMCVPMSNGDALSNPDNLESRFEMESENSPTKKSIKKRPGVSDTESLSTTPVDSEEKSEVEDEDSLKESDSANVKIAQEKAQDVTVTAQSNKAEMTLSTILPKTEPPLQKLNMSDASSMGMQLKSGTIIRMMFVLVGATIVVVIYFAIKTVRMRRNSRVRKYGLLSTGRSNDLELSPLDLDDDDEEEDNVTLFDKSDSYR